MSGPHAPKALYHPGRPAEDRALLPSAQVLASCLHDCCMDAERSSMCTYSSWILSTPPCLLVASPVLIPWLPACAPWVCPIGHV